MGTAGHQNGYSWLYLIEFNAYEHLSNCFYYVSVCPGHHSMYIGAVCIYPLFFCVVQTLPGMKVGAAMTTISDCDVWTTHKLGMGGGGEIPQNCIPRTPLEMGPDWFEKYIWCCAILTPQIVAICDVREIQHYMCYLLCWVDTMNFIMAEKGTMLCVVLRLQKIRIYAV